MAKKHRTGYLFKKRATFYCRWVVDGKVFVQALRDESGNVIQNRREAESAREKLMAPFAVGDEVTALESLSAKLDGRRGELARLENELNPGLTVNETWLAYLEAPNRPDTGESTLRQYEFQWNAFAGWMAENHPAAPALRDVSKPIAETYAAHLVKRGLSANSFNKHLNLLGLVSRVLKDKARLNGNPWTEIQRKRLAPQGRRELTVDELKTVCLAAKGELRTLLAVGLYTGLRLSDVATLLWGEVDLQQGVIRRIPSKTARRNPQPITIPIHPVLHGVLSETPAAARAEFVLPETAALYAQRIDWVTDKIQQHFAACGIRTIKPGTGKAGKRAVVQVGFHSLRHSFVSLCRMSGTPLAVVESIVGHSSPAMTRHYTHVGELAAAQAVGALPNLITETAQAAPPQSSTDAWGEVTRLAETMTAKNWQAARGALLEITARVAGQNT